MGEHLTLAEVIRTRGGAENGSGKSLSSAIADIGDATPEEGAGPVSSSGDPDALPDAVSAPYAGRGDFALAVELIAQIARALAHAHAHGIIHRDIKPHNILIDTTGKPYLSDFGLAKDVDLASISFSGEVTGTVHYMSVEQVSGKGLPVDHRTDIYSLGITLYELLALKRPFDGETREQICRQILEKERAPLRKLNPRIPRDIETVVHKAIEKSPARRYRTAAEMAEDLERILRFEAVQAKPPGWARRAVRWARGHPLPMASFAAVLLLAVVFVLAFLSIQKDERALNLRQRTMYASASGFEKSIHANAVLSPEAGERTRERAINHYTRLLLDKEPSSWIHALPFTEKRRPPWEAFALWKTALLKGCVDALPDTMADPEAVRNGLDLLKDEAYGEIGKGLEAITRPVVDAMLCFKECETVSELGRRLDSCNNQLKRILAPGGAFDELMEEVESIREKAEVDLVSMTGELETFRGRLVLWAAVMDLLTPVSAIAGSTGTLTGTQRPGPLLIADLDGDSGNALLFTSYDRKGEEKYCRLNALVNGEISELHTWKDKDLIPRSIEVEDLDGDGIKEIAVSGDVTSGSAAWVFILERDEAGRITGLWNSEDGAGYRTGLKRCLMVAGRFREGSPPSLYLSPSLTEHGGRKHDLAFSFGPGGKVSEADGAELDKETMTYALRICDLNQDGRDEILLCSGEWNGYGIKLIGYDDHDDRYKILWRKRFGIIQSILPFHEAGEAGEDAFLLLFKGQPFGAQRLDSRFYRDLPGDGLYLFQAKGDSGSPTFTEDAKYLLPFKEGIWSWRVWNVNEIRTGESFGPGPAGTPRLFAAPMLWEIKDRLPRSGRNFLAFYPLYMNEGKDRKTFRVKDPLLLWAGERLEVLDYPIGYFRPYQITGRLKGEKKDRLVFWWREASTGAMKLLLCGGSKGDDSR